VHANKEAFLQSRYKGNPLWYLFGRLWHYSVGNKKNVVAYWIMFALANTIVLTAMPLLMAKLINTVQEEGVTESNQTFLSCLLALAVATRIIFWALHGPARCIERNNAFEVRANYRKYLLAGIMNLPMEWHTDHHSGDTIDKVGKGSEAIFSFASDSFEVIYSMVQFLVSYAMLAYFSPSAAYIVLVMISVSICITMYIDRFLINQYIELNQRENSITESIFDSVSNISTVIILRVEALVFKGIVGKIYEPQELFRRNQRLNELKWFMTSITCALMTLLVLKSYIQSNINTPKGVLIGSLFLLIKYLDEISDVFFRFTGMYSEIVKNRARVMNSEEISKDFRTESFTNHVLPDSWQNLEISDLNFSYHGEKCTSGLHLDGIRLSLARGERIAFVGESGGGKTTLLKVMRDLYHPRSIKLAVDGKIIPDGFGGISRAISLVPQDPEIFATTILENISLGAEYNHDVIKHFTDMACFSDVVESLPNKFDSSINEKGVNLSGGQRQRLALVRGLLACRDKDIVLLDEPTSSLDTGTEMRVYGNIFREFRGKTIISSIHRLHLLPLFNRIYMFSKGQIIASGTLTELLTCCPEFQELWRQYNNSKEEMVA
jgi:ATP-binding cassette, subfamily B, bacterial